MEIREVELPGIGHKYALHTDEGERLTVILHNTGHREIYQFEKGGEFPACATRLTDDEGRKLGAILTGAFYQPVGEANLDTVLGQLTFHWHEVEDGVLDGRTIGELGIRKQTGASIIARLREGEPPQTNAGPETRLRSGDTLIVIGSREQVEAFRTFASGASPGGGAEAGDDGAE